MRQPLVLALGIIVALTLTGGCSRQDKAPVDIREKQIPAESLDQVLPKYPSRYWQEGIKNEMAALQPEERHLLEKFISRHIKTSPSIDQIPLPDGTTIKQAIFAQRIVDTVTERQEAEIAALRELSQKLEGELLALRGMAELRRDDSVKNSISATRPSNVSGPAEDVTAYAKARQEALINYRVPEMEEQLRISMQKDRSDRRWQEFQTDSPTTAAIRIQLLMARRAADQLFPPYTSGR